MCEKSQDRGFLIDIPHDNTLIIRATDKSLSVSGNGEPSDPSFMTIESFFAIASTGLPESDGLIPGAWEDHIAFRVEINIWDVMVVPIESFEA